MWRVPAAHSCGTWAAWEGLPKGKIFPHKRRSMQAPRALAHPAWGRLPAVLPRKSGAASQLGGTEKPLSCHSGTPLNPPGRAVSWQLPVCRKRKPPTWPAARLAGIGDEHSSQPLNRESRGCSGLREVLTSYTKRKGKHYFGWSQLFCCGQTTMFYFNLNLLKFAFDTFSYVHKKCLEEFPTQQSLFQKSNE